MCKFETLKTRISSASQITTFHQVMEVAKSGENELKHQVLEKGIQKCSDVPKQNWKGSQEEM